MFRVVTKYNGATREDVTIPHKDFMYEYSCSYFDKDSGGALKAWASHRCKGRS